MKSILFLFLIISQTILFGQHIDWVGNSNVKEFFFSDKTNCSGHYLGEIDGKSYYTYYTREKKTLETPIDVKISFFIESDGLIENSTFFSEKLYKILDIFIVNNQLAVVYREDSKELLQIKIDYYDPQTFQVINTKNLNSVTRKHKKSDFVALIQTNETTLNKMLYIGEKLNDNEGFDLTFFVLDPNLNSIYNRSFFVQKKKSEISLRNVFLTNKNQVILFNSYVNSNDNQKDYLKITQLSEQDSTSIEKQVTQTKSIVDLNIYPLKEETQYLLSYSKNSSINFSFIDFNNLTISEPLEQIIHSGFWKIFNVVELKNNNIAICYNNYSFSHYQDEKTNVYFTLHPLSFGVTSINTKELKINYSVTIPRYFSFPNRVNLNFKALNHLPYIIKDDDGLYFLYNTDINFDNQTINVNETNQFRKINNLKTKLQCTYINNAGDFEHIETEETNDDSDYFAAPFTKIIDQNKVQIYKINNNKISVGYFIIK